MYFHTLTLPIKAFKKPSQTNFPKNSIIITFYTPQTVEIRTPYPVQLLDVGEASLEDYNGDRFCRGNLGIYRRVGDKKRKGKDGGRKEKKQKKEQPNDTNF